LRGSPPVAVSTKCINIGQNPGGNNIIRLFTRVSQEIKPYGNAFFFKPYEEFFG